MRLLLIRHGQTPSNVLGLLDTAAPGAGLTELGRQQAEQVPVTLADARIDSIWVSTLLRTALTAAPLERTTGFPARLIDGLEEISAGDLENKSNKASVRTYLETAFAWAEGDLDRRMPGGPDGLAFFARYDAAIDVVAEGGGETAVVFSHGAAIRVWVAARAGNSDAASAEAHGLRNTGCVELEGSPSDGWTLVKWTETPVDGALSGAAAADPTGESLDD